VSVFLVATRSAHKLREIRGLLEPLPGISLIDPDAAGISPRPEEDDIENFSTFEENALAKARFFARRAGLPVISDDSGLCVDALAGGPGVLSKRYSGSTLSGLALDLANNVRLLEELDGLPPERRAAHYVCVIALVLPDGSEEVFRGTVHGRILDAPRGEGGFGYDPLFFLDCLGATFAQVDAATKNRMSHRAAAVTALRPRLREIASVTFG